MKFLYPQFLFALFALAIPIIVHLFNFRRFKRVLFTNVRFLQEIKQDTKHRSRLKHLLVLASRLLALTCLVLAFAQPYLPVQKGVSRAVRSKVSIWVDNSFSMNASGKYGPLLDVARERAREIALTYKPSDQFQLITNDFEARHQRFVNREEFLQLLDEIRPSSSVRTLSQVVRRQEEAFTGSPSVTGEQRASFLLSDFQTSLSDESAMPLDTAVSYFVIPFVAQAQNNLYIDTCYLQNPYVQPGSTQELLVRIKNAGDEEVKDVPLKLTINGSQKAVAVVTAPGGGVTEAKLPFTISGSGLKQAVLAIADYPVTFDDTFYFSFNVRPNVQVTCINGSDRSPYLDALYANDPYFIYRAMGEGQVDYNALPSQQLVILNQVQQFASGLQQELLRYMQNGGRVMLLPNEKQESAGYAQFAASTGIPALSEPTVINEKVSKVETNHPLLSGIFERDNKQTENLDLPVVLKAFKQTAAARSGTQTILQLESGAPYLSYTPVGKGGCFVLSTPLDPTYTGFQQHALFVPVFLKAVFLGASEISPGEITGTFSVFTAGDTVLSGDQVFHLTNPVTGFDAIADARRSAAGTQLSVQDQVRVAGIYSVIAGKHPVNAIAFNYDRKESDLRTLSTEAIDRIFSGAGAEAPTRLNPDDPSVGHALARLREGISLWKYLIVFTLLFLAAEVLLIRYFKN